MNIGNGPLEIGMIGFSENGELSIPQLKDLAKSTLEIYPLGDIFHLSDINITRIPDVSGFVIEFYELSEMEKMRLTRNFDVIAAIKENVLPRCHPDGKYLYSKLSPMVFAHELGHALGLDPFFISCCSPYLFNELKTLEETQCPYWGYVMCGDRHAILGNRGFSPENIEKLEEWYLK